MTKKCITELETPCLILDLDILEHNIQKMQAWADQAGKQLRPHAKTHKCSTLARKQLDAGAIGVCVAKLSEAEALVRQGLDNILITGPIVTATGINKLVQLAKASPSLMGVIDNAGTANLLDKTLASADQILDVLLDVDVGLNRTGAKPGEAMALADHITACPRLHLKGIQAYAGQVQHIHSHGKRKQASLDCLDPAVSIFKALKDQNPGCTIFSASGTGTFDIDTQIPEITELQVGSYVCMDAEYLEIGSPGTPAFTDFQPALKLLTTVVSANHETFVTVDAGLKTLYSHGGIPKVIGPEKFDLAYDWFGDEYGMVSNRNDSALPAIGTVLELITSHCDPTVNLFDKFVITQGNKIKETWPIDLRGCSQ